MSNVKGTARKSNLIEQERIRKIVSTSVVSLLVGTLFLSSQLAVKADQDDPNGVQRQPDPGWSWWKPKAEIKNADFDSGFSNLELGGYMDFEHACATEADRPNAEIDYWFRLSNSVARIGTGKVQYGCWMNGHFLQTSTSTAIKTSLGSVNCLRVNSPTGRLAIRSEPRMSSRQVKVASNGSTVDPGYMPADIIEADGQNWIAISSPVKGWISDGSPTSQGNLTLCKR